MRTTHLRKGSGPVMRAVPPALLDVLPLIAGARSGWPRTTAVLWVAPGGRKRESAPAAIVNDVLGSIATRIK